MRLLLLWAVAAWVVSVIADRPCSEYCVYLSSGIHDIEFQQECDCMYEEEPELWGRLDDSGIYYEPVDYIPLPTYIHHQPFFILNPIIRGRQTYSTNNNPVIPKNVHPHLISRTYDTDKELDPESTYSTHNRHEKDIQLKTEGLIAPVYLDINVESGDVERLAYSNTFNGQDFELTEQSLLECTKLYAALQSRKHKEANQIGTTRPSQLDEYNHISNEELTKVMKNKCSHISYIVEKSLNEIKKARPKLSSVTFKMESEEGSSFNDIHNVNKHTICRSSTEKNSQSSVEREDSQSIIKEDNDNREQTIIIYPDLDESTSENLSTLSAEEISTTAVSNSDPNIKSSSNIHNQTDDVSKKTTSTMIEQSSPLTSIYTKNEYPRHKTSITLQSTTTTTESSTPPTLIFAKTKKVEPEILESRHTSQEFKVTNIEGRLENRAQYKEGDVPLPKIITHEFSNNTVQSFINGTEDIPNGEFDNEIKATEVNSATEDFSQILPYYQYSESTPGEFKTTTVNTEEHTTTTADISGNIYFVFNNNQIPAKFVQNVNGSLHLGIDGVTLCNTMSENGENHSGLLTTLCNCYKSDNCAQKGST